MNTTILNWNSTDFIGVNNIFPISSVGPARNLTRGTTVATRFDTYVEGGNTVIISQLRVIASEQFPSSAVTCRMSGDGPSETIHFITTGMGTIIKFCIHIHVHAGENEARTHAIYC